MNLENKIAFFLQKIFEGAFVVGNQCLFNDAAGGGRELASKCRHGLKGTGAGRVAF
ncbi:MAG: hypothetical protein LJE63_09830 [Desulfobacteraceae bacterium]|nr:hypothetical protein [Desulfobacteraceae bacterium]